MDELLRTEDIDLNIQIYPLGDGNSMCKSFSMEGWSVIRQTTRFE